MPCSSSASIASHSLFRRRNLLAALLLAVAPLVAVPGSAQAARPVVVELFTSQGCSDCPPANANLNAIADRPDVLALSFGVTYWDNLGWKDTFAKPQYTARQWEYAHAFHHAEVFTPQMVVDGRRDTVGAKRSDIDPLIHKAEADDGQGPALAIAGGALKVAPGGGRHGDIWLVRYDPRVVDVPVARGENSGRTLPHRNVVRELTKIGTLTAQAQTLRLPPSRDRHLATAAFIQTSVGGPIISAVKG